MKTFFTLLFIVPLLANASGNILTFDEINNKKAAPVRKTKKQAKKANSRSAEKELEETKKQLDAYRYRASLQIRKPIVLGAPMIGEGDLVGAKTAAGVMATNTPTKIYLSNIVGVDLPTGSKISCTIIAKYKRVCGSCDRLIIDGRGIDISADLLNRDGSSCVIGELSSDGELYMTSIAISELAQGALAVSQSSIPTIGGNIIQNSAANKINQGLINVGGEATEMFKEKYKTEEPIVLVKRKTDVIVQFNERVEL